MSLTLAVTLVVFMPQLVRALTGQQVSWAQIYAQFSALSPQAIALMAAVWLLSLLAYTFVLTASLPGLTHPQALVLNAAAAR
ncbi:hypothetical protein ACFQX6_56750 [Streptosporangium lutulentum]